MARDLSPFMRLLYPDLFLKRSFLCSSIAILTYVIENTCCVSAILYAVPAAVHALERTSYSYLVDVDSVMGYRVTFDRASLRGIPEGGIVSREEIENPTGTREEFFHLKYCRSCTT